MINLESTEFRAIKTIMLNVENIYEDMADNKSIFSFMEKEEAIKMHLEIISKSLFTLLSRKTLSSYIKEYAELRED